MKTIAGFCVGLGAGLALGTLFAPRAGHKTRTLVRNAAADGVAYVKRRTDEVREGAIGFVKDATDKVVQEADGVKAAVVAGKRAYEKVVAT